MVWQARYTKELQSYLQATGLKASDLVKPRSRKGRSSVQGKPTSVPATATHVLPQAVGMDDAARGALPHFSQVWATSAQTAPAAVGQAMLSSTATSSLPLTAVYRYSDLLPACLYILYSFRLIRT